MTGSQNFKRIDGSYRDPSGYVYQQNGRIFRSVTTYGASNYEASRDTLRKLVSEGKLLGFEERDPRPLRGSDTDVVYLLEHPKLDVISMPYEWPFALLKDAALFHLKLNIELLSSGFTLSDASAYNIQFQGTQPIFIDHLSVRPYKSGEFWAGHRQFCEQFLCPLLLRAYCGIPHNAWFRGTLEGISIEQLERLLPWRAKALPTLFLNVVLPARIQRKTTSETPAGIQVKHRALPLNGFKSLLRQLHAFIEKLEPAERDPTIWANYATTTTYSDRETEVKKKFVADFVKATNPRTVIDFGCNVGAYSQVAFTQGAERCIGFDFDQQALDAAVSIAKTHNYHFLPLFLDARNPSPNQGWLQQERLGFRERFRGDGLLALAFEHHLAIAANIPLAEMLDWFTSVAPTGVIEFVPKEDPTVQKMLTLRDDIFTDYTRSNFESYLAERATIVRSETVSASGRVLYQYAC